MAQAEAWQLRFWRERSGKGVEAELAIQIAASAGVSSSKPAMARMTQRGIDDLASASNSLANVRVAQDGVLDAGGELQKIG